LDQILALISVQSQFLTLIYYDVARLLVGSKGQLAMVIQISFKVMPDTYVGKLNAAVKLENKSVLRTEIEQKLKQVFDPRGVPFSAAYI
jgi:glycolate oxidase FAD binding subunit